MSQKSDCSVLASKEHKKLADENICLKPETIHKVVEHISKNGSKDQDKDKVNKPRDPIDKWSKDTAIYKEIRKENDCTNDVCLLETELVKNDKQLTEIIKDEINDRVKPEGPWNSTKWFSNFNIDDYFRQIALAYPEYFHNNFAMSDFAQNNFGSSQINDGNLANLNLPELFTKTKCRKTGCVVNTDVSSGKGIHWFAVFCCYDESRQLITIEFFNSSGNKPREPIHDWMIKMQIECETELKNKNVKVERIIASQNRHQYSESECGPYSCYYITKRVEGKPYTYFMENRIPDEEMIEFRKVMFRKF
jgi:hypothetical protein